MKKYNQIWIIAIAIAVIVSGSVFANPSIDSLQDSLQFENDNHENHSHVIKMTERSWTCSYCGFHMVTKSGRIPASGKCFKNNNGPHNWQED